MNGMPEHIKSGLAEHTICKYRDLNYVTGAKPATDATKATTATPQVGGFLMPIPKDPLTQALMEGRALDGMVLGVVSSEQREPVHPLERLRAQWSYDNGLAEGAGACFASSCDCV